MGHRLLWIAVIAWIVSLFLPVDPGVKNLEKFIDDGRADWIGLDAMEASYDFDPGVLGQIDDPEGRMQMRWYRWAWLANIGLLLGVFGIFPLPKPALRTLAVLASLMAILAAAGVVIPMLNGNDMPQYGPGYWTWLASLVGITLGIGLRSLESEED